MPHMNWIWYDLHVWTHLKAFAYCIIKFGIHLICVYKRYYVTVFHHVMDKKDAASQEKADIGMCLMSDFLYIKHVPC